MNPFFQLTLAVAVSMLVIPVARRFAPRLGLVDMPDEARKVHSIPIPRIGGWGITLGILLPLLLAFRLDPLIQSFVFGCLALFAFGVWDDARNISHWFKFIGQLLAVAAVVYYGDLWVSRLPFIDAAIPAAIGKPFTMFALIGVINAINHSDGLDGLAGGEVVLSLIALAILGYMSVSNSLPGGELVLGLSLATIGGIFGFLRYNSHPAYVFMGDCGSQVLGFTLGVLVVYLTQVADTAVSAALPLLILGLPVADILSVFYQRIRGGMNWFRATRNHIHHRLLQLGFDQYEAVVIIYLVQATLVVAAVLLRFESDLSVALTYAAVIAAVFCSLWVAERHGWQLQRAKSSESPLARAIAKLSASEGALRVPLVVITALTPAIMLLSALWVTSIPSDVATAAAILAVVPATQLLWPRAVKPVLLRLAVYATAVFPAYLLVTAPAAVPQSMQFVAVPIIVLLAVAVVAYVRLSAEERFGTTPTDYLIVCGVVALTVFGSIQVNSRNIVEAVLLATVLSYACEIIVGSTPENSGRRLLQYSTLGTLLIISLRGVI